MANENEVQKQQHLRAYVQWGGPRPGNLLRYAGVDAQDLAIGDIEDPIKGDLSPIFAQDPGAYDRYKKLGNSQDPPDNPSTTLTFMHRHGGIPRHMLDFSCPFTVYQVGGYCKDPSDPIGGWDTVDVLAGCDPTTRSKNNNTAFDSDDPRMTEVEVTLDRDFMIGPIGMGDGASVDVTTEVLDVTYGTASQCGNCGPENDGSKFIYAVVKAGTGGSASAPAYVFYSLDGGATWASSPITAAATTEIPCAIRVIGNYLVVFSPTAGGVSTGGYYYSALNADTGAPGSWTKVTTGFVAASAIRDVFVQNPRQVYICADGGYIYKLSSVPNGVTVLNAGATTTSNLLRIRGDKAGKLIVAVGATGACIKSVNQGATFSAVAGSVGAGSNQMVCVIDARHFWVGNAAGALYYTLNQGATFSQQTIADAAAIQDMVCAYDGILYLAYTTASPDARLWWSLWGGEQWGNAADAAQARIIGLPTADRFNRIAVPTARVETNVSYVALAGLAGNGTDGILVVGAPSVK